MATRLRSYAVQLDSFEREWLHHARKLKDDLVAKDLYKSIVMSLVLYWRDEGARYTVPEDIAEKLISSVTNELVDIYATNLRSVRNTRPPTVNYGVTINEVTCKPQDYDVPGHVTQALLVAHELDRQGFRCLRYELSHAPKGPVLTVTGKASEKFILDKRSIRNIISRLEPAPLKLVIKRITVIDPKDPHDS